MAEVFSDHKWLQIPDGVRNLYNAWDCVATARLYKALHVELASNGQWDFYAREFWPTIPAILRIQQRGLGVDLAKRTALKQAVSREITEAEKVILSKDTDGLLAKPTEKYPNGINSHPRLAKYLYGTLGLKPTKRTESGFPSTDQESLDQLLRNLRKKDHHARPILESLFHRSRLHTIRSRYLDFDVRIVDGQARCFPTYKAGRAKTLRLAVEDPPIQQYPSEARGIFVPSQGRVFVSADMSQVEARLLALHSGDEPSLRVFREGGDVHAANAQDLLGYTVEEWGALDPTVRKAARNFAKTFLYGMSYGGKAETMKLKLFCPCPKCTDKVPPMMDLTRTQVRNAEWRWFALHSAVPRWREDLLSRVRRGGYSLTTPFSHKRYFLRPIRDCEREIYNFPMQNGAAILMNRATRALDALEAPIVLQVHDQLVLEVEEAEWKSWARRLKEVMEVPTPELDGAVFPVDISVGDSWQSLEEQTSF